MTETVTEAPERATTAAMFDAPADAAEAVATGYKVYNRTLGRYVGPTTDTKPSNADARKAVPEGHVSAVVRV